MTVNFYKRKTRTLFTPVVLLLIMLLSGGLSARAQQKLTVSTVLEGKNGGIRKDSLRETIDVAYYSPLFSSILDPANDRYVNSIALYVDEEDKRLADSDFKVDVFLTLIWTDMHGSVDSINGRQLTIDYRRSQDTLGKHRAYLQMDSCRKLKVRVDSVSLNGALWDATRMLVLENRMEVSRQFVFECINTVTGLEHETGPLSASLSYDKLVVSWDPSTAPGTTDYDLEWSWIDYEARDRYKVSEVYNADAIFKNNSTRITIPGNQTSFGIPLLYDGEGLLFYRVRPVQVQENDQVIAGTWTAVGSNYYHYDEGHQPNLNWQVSTSFAEDGKHKTVIQYFDGTLRNRQSVTKDNDTETTVVAETLYDYQGRPAISILPAPTLNQVIEYAHNFNRFNTDTYAKDLYDVVPELDLACDMVTPALDSTSGTSQYYSSNNLLINSIIGNSHNYIPAAFGYPYVETLYTPDATGRIAAQGGVGPEYQLNTNRETKYFYGSPEQKELDALFGTEVGDASHYFKNMVRDANGQYSVSYVDMAGRTIATALAGRVPDSLEQLPGYQARYFTRNLLSDGNNTVKDRTVESSTTLVVGLRGMHDFYYELSPQSAEIKACTPEGEPVCYDCYYDLEIRISSPCLEEPIIISRRNFTFGEYDVSCSTAAPSLIVEESFMLEEGEYNITKTLRLSKDAQDWYRKNVFAVNNLACNSIQTLYEENYSILVDAENCNVDCTTCENELGTYADFRAAFLIAQGVDPETEVPYEAEIQASYQHAADGCKLLCEPEAENKLDQIRMLMLQDMIPNQGQYALTDRDMNDDGVIDETVTVNGVTVTETLSNKPFNIFSTKIPHRYHAISREEYKSLVPVFTHPFNPANETRYYVDGNGNQDPRISSTTAVLAGYTPEAFTTVFRDEWAKSVLYYHPEYDKLKYAEENLKESYDWDVTLENTDTWAAAVTAGFISNNILDLDPFLGGPLGQERIKFQSGIFDLTFRKFREVMSDNLTDEYRNTGKTMWQLAWILVNCKEIDQSCINDAPNGPPFSLTGCETDMDNMWRMFRTLYLSEKERLLSILVHQETIHEDRDKILNNPAYGYQRRFPVLVGKGNVLQEWQDIADDKNPEDAAQDALAGDFEELVDATCNGYVDLWRNRLLECETLRDHPNSKVILDKILLGLVDVCKRGTDWEHIEGSSTVSPQMGGTPASFEEVIRKEFLAAGISLTDICHPYMIDYPQPYNHQTPVSNSGIIDVQDECACTRLQELETNQHQDRFNGTLSQYIAAKYGITVRPTLLDSIRRGCDGEFECKQYDPPLLIPAILDCETSLASGCIDCRQYSTLKSEFITLHPTYSSVFFEDPADEVQVSSNKFLAQFFNTRTGFAKSWVEYLDFEKECTVSPCDSLQDILALYYENGGDTVSAVNCETAFTTFFNTQAGTSLTYAQINAAFLESCGKPLDVCAPVLNCTGFKNIIDSFYTRYGNTVSLDVDCDSLFADHFNGIKNTSYSFAQLQDLYRRTCGGVLDVCRKGLDCDRLQNILDAWKSCNPVVFLSSGCDSLWVAYFNAQAGTSYSYYQVDSLYKLCNIKLDPCKVQANCSTLKKLLFAYENADSLACAPAGLNPVDNCQDCFTWYLNDKLGTSYSNAQVSQLYLDQCGVILQLCGPSFKCKELASLSNQFTLWLQANPGAASCDSLFTVEFNNHFNLEYTYAQVSSVYKKFCGRTLEFCAPQPPVSAHQLQDIRQSFLQLYPDPAKYFGDSCEAAFKRFYNAVAGDTLSYESIRMSYILVAGTDLNVCAPDTCLQRKELVTRFNNQFGGYRWPQAMARDLFTALYNQTYKPVQPYYWSDIKRWFLDDTCDAVMPDFAADSTYPLTCANLEGAIRAFSILYSTATQEDCGKLFTGMINTYFGTSFTTLDQLQRWADDNCGDLQLKICGGTPVEASVMLRTTVLAPTTVLGPRLCHSGSIVPPIEVEEKDECDYQHTMALHIATEQYQVFVQQQNENFDSTYRNKCLNAGTQEIFTVRAQAAEYHYTLYYYDRAGNLVKTIPPAGVDMSHMSNGTDYEEWHQSVKTAREEGTALLPQHVLGTQYRYNSLNQVIAQSSPDAGVSHFWYDRLGRLVISQNAKQEEDDKYSYTKYDVLGRITEVGQIMGASVSPGLTRNPVSLASWFSSHDELREQIINMYHDLPAPGLCEGGASLICQANLRNRLSFATVTDLATDLNYASARFFNYDIHGNIDELLMHYFKGAMQDVEGHAFKKIKYKYDLINGLVNEVSYQPGKRDQFYHRYEYDAANRLKQVSTSHDYLYWERQAAYKYYKHDLLARIDLGQQRVQGVDFAYTLQGWLKGINSAANGASFDIGGDGANISRAARDVYALQLQFNRVDYKAVKEVYPFGTVYYLDNQEDGIRTGRGLFNGNISSAIINIPQLGDANLYGYAYDQLGRIVGVNAYHGINNTTGEIVPSAAVDNAYKERISYDANNNILIYKRNGEPGNPIMDNLTYKYFENAPGEFRNNRLRLVEDVVANGNYVSDIDDQISFVNNASDSNYVYDAVGNLVTDKQEGIISVEWSVYGKIKKIIKSSNLGSTTIEYSYDVSGNRISKSVSLDSGTPSVTWYVRDASGSVMAVYEKDNVSINDGKLTQVQVPIHGDLRLGMWNPMRALEGENWETSGITPIPGTSGIREEEFVRGRTQYELSNHLENVLVTISDNRIPVDDGTYEVVEVCPTCLPGFPCIPCYNVYTKTSSSLDGVVDYYQAHVLTANDYYAYGMLMPGRKYSKDGVYRYGFNGKENDNDVKGEGHQQDYGLRIYDPRLGKFLSVDPLADLFAWNGAYAYSEGDPINFIDLEGSQQPIQRPVTVPRPATPSNGRITVPKELLKIDPAGGGSKPPPTLPAVYTPPVGNTSKPTQVSMEWLTEAEVRALVPPNGDLTVNPDGKSVTVYNANGLSRQYSLLKTVHKAKSFEEMDWVERLNYQTQLNLQKMFGPTKVSNDRGFYEYITTDPSTLTDEYLNEVSRRLLLGEGSNLDKLYANEVAKRKKAGTVDALETVTFKQGKDDKAKMVTLIVPKGFKEVRSLKSQGQKVFKKGKIWISPDVDGHNGGSWKMWDNEKNVGSKEKSKRKGTYSADLKTRVGD